MGAVHLGVTDGERAVSFYRDVVGLTVLESTTDQATLGVQGQELVVLRPGARAPVPQGTTGLYHLALVLPERKELARVIARLISMRVPNSPTDHLMTKSDYLWDPDGNGIEIYIETPEDGSWTFENGGFGARDAGGSLRSGRDPIDVPALLGELGPKDQLEAPLPDGTRMGHVHLHVGNIDAALHFYADLIGFDVQGVAPGFGVAFVSAGGYHHHLGLNTWAGVGAPPAPPTAAGLRHFAIELPTENDLAAVASRLHAGGAMISDGPQGRFVTDPSGNRIRLEVRKLG